MLVEIKKTELREINLQAPLYVLFANSSYHRFAPIDENIEVCNFQERDGNFELSVRKGVYESQIKILELTSEFAKEISEEDFNGKLQELLLKYI